MRSVTVKVAEIVEPRTSAVAGDSYVPATVTWIAPEFVGLPLLVGIEDRVDGYEGGRLTVKLEPLTGEIAGAVVVNAPKAGPGPGFVRPAELPTVAGGIRVDRTPWQLNPDLVATLEVIGETGPLTLFEDDEHVFFGFSESVPVKKVMAGGAGFTVDRDEVLTGLVIERGPTGFRLS
jgi:hypothetical protein